MADVALAAAVHTGTASRALNTKSEHQVNPCTVARVKSAAGQLEIQSCSDASRDSFRCRCR
jgi:DNA-binding LacI/PurR family transcriptional regulator